MTNHKWYNFSLISGLIPLVFGCLIFITWLISRADWLALAGVYTIMAGLMLFVFGLLFLVIYWIKERKFGNAYPIKRSLISLGILLLNFPVLLLILYFHDYISNTVTVRVVNNFPFAITDMTLFERDHLCVYPPIAPGQEVIEHFHFKFEGSIHYRLSLAGSKKEGIAFGYVSSGTSNSTVMVITEDGEVEAGEMSADLGNGNHDSNHHPDSYADWVLQSIKQRKSSMKHKMVQGMKL